LPAYFFRGHPPIPDRPYFGILLNRIAKTPIAVDLVPLMAEKLRANS
jgi:hypothetical protein